MNGDTTGLEPADGGREDDARPSRGQIDELFETAASLEKWGEYKAAREVHDAASRIRSEEDQREAGAARERQRSGETLHGEDPQAPEVDGRS